MPPLMGNRREYLKLGIFLDEFYLHNYCRSSFWQKELLEAECWNFAINSKCQAGFAGGDRRVGGTFQL